MPHTTIPTCGDCGYPHATPGCPPSEVAAAKAELLADLGAGRIVGEILERVATHVDLTDVPVDDLSRAMVAGGLAANELARRMDRNGHLDDADDLRQIAANLPAEATR